MANACLTNDRKYYEENVPDLVVERAGIDDVILMMTGGEKDEWIIREDICLLLKGHRNTMILFLMICVFLGLSQTDTFILGYFPFLMIVLLIGTLSCDEADNGLPFLFTLPIDRKLYIREKYLFCVAGTVVSFVLAWAYTWYPCWCTAFECIWCSLGKCGNDTGLSGGIFHHPFPS